MPARIWFFSGGLIKAKDTPSVRAWANARIDAGTGPTLLRQDFGKDVAESAFGRGAGGNSFLRTGPAG
jgi:hypothetical protein